MRFTRRERARAVGKEVNYKHWSYSVFISTPGGSVLQSSYKYDFGWWIFDEDQEDEDDFMSLNGVYIGTARS